MFDDVWETQFIRDLVMRCQVVAATLFFGIVSFGFGQADSATIQRIVDEGKNRNQVMRTLRDLTRIGPRVTGSPTLQRAAEWTADQFRKAGCKNVRLEKWGEVPVGFERGRRQVGRMVAPFESEIRFTTMNWMPGTSGKVQGPAVMNPTSMEEFEAIKPKLKGAWVVMDTPVGMRGTDLPESDVKKAVDGAGIAGRIFGARDERVHSHGTWRDKSYEKRPTEVRVYVRRSDYDRITRNVRFGRDVRLEFDIENKWFKGPVAQFNVIADIPGTEKPDEMVIICGHLDSWNTPGSEGTCDNATGSSVAIEAARILNRVGAKPKRTIRFILWTGEEQGLLGSRAYVEMHKDEMAKVSAVLNDDGGTNYQGGYVGIESMRPMMEAAFAPTVAAFPEMPMKFNVVAEMPQSGSSDHAPFNWAGVPGFFTMETGRADYGRVWHTQFDRYEEAIPEYLRQSSTNHAVVSYYLANAPTLLPRGPKPAPRQALSVLDHNHAMGSDHLYESPEEHLRAGCNHDDDYVLEFFDRLQRAFRLYMR